jgi:predicted short-subunit dehydrogenase-like oxidoreductase (DUF2520 family)
MLSSDPTILSLRLAVVGDGRLGRALSIALRETGFAVDGPLGRGHDGAGADAVLLCVPDGEIRRAADLVAPGILVGHCSGAEGLDAVGDREAFSLHPLMTFTTAGGRFAGAGAAVAGSTERALALADTLARRLGMEPVQVADADRPAYHAAASIASNFLITLEAAAETIGRTAGLERGLLVPLVRATVDNWAALGARDALTGPVARGDRATVERQRQAVADRAPALAPMFEALVAATESLVAMGQPA